MKVIKENHTHEKTAFCRQCGSILGYYPHDVFRRSERYVEIFITCPVCGHDIILENLNLEQYFKWESNFNKWRDGIED